ncbi:hypothetical protein Glove_83g97 [Diversispora epigaea]|uniref:Uncharacterized protein n=1 Tax=Diversispora epigaea TaxID=1348612 RepID=A0A397J7M0_9GLOM|nr:hypothetical protein Glove_83g97 [Diversispora epigaea]
MNDYKIFESDYRQRLNQFQKEWEAWMDANFKNETPQLLPHNVTDEVISIGLKKLNMQRLNQFQKEWEAWMDANFKNETPQLLPHNVTDEVISIGLKKLNIQSSIQHQVKYLETGWLPRLEKDGNLCV